MNKVYYIYPIFGKVTVGFDTKQSNWVVKILRNLMKTNKQKVSLIFITACFDNLSTFDNILNCIMYIHIINFTLYADM